MTMLRLTLNTRSAEGVGDTDSLLSVYVDVRRIGVYILKPEPEVKKKYFPPPRT